MDPALEDAPRSHFVPHRLRRPVEPVREFFDREIFFRVAHFTASLKKFRPLVDGLQKVDVDDGLHLYALALIVQ